MIFFVLFIIHCIQWCSKEPAKETLRREKQPKCQPTRFSAVSGWSQHLIERADILATDTLPPLVISLAGTLYSTQTLSLYHLNWLNGVRFNISKRGVGIHSRFKDRTSVGTQYPITQVTSGWQLTRLLSRRQLSLCREHNRERGVIAIPRPPSCRHWLSAAMHISSVHCFK